MLLYKAIGVCMGALAVLLFLRYLWIWWTMGWFGNTEESWKRTYIRFEIPRLRRLLLRFAKENQK